MIIEKLPHIRRTDPGAKIVQTFLSPEEKEQFEQVCESKGFKMTHVLRCLAVQFIQSQSFID